MTLHAGTTSSDPSEEDRRLLERVACADRQAFEVLYRRYYRRVFQFVLRLVRNDTAAEEVVDDVMFAVWQGACRFAGGSAVSTWMMSIAFRQATKALDRNRKHARADGDEEALNAAIDPDPAADPEWVAIADSDGALLQAGMMALADHHRAVMQLTVMGHDYEEIARIVDCSKNTVKTRMFYARRQLKHFLSAAMKQRDVCFSSVGTHGINSQRS